MMFYETISLTCILPISLRIWLLLSVAILFSYIVTARLNWGKTYQIVIMNRLTKPTAICRYLRSLTIVIRVLSDVEWSQCVRFEVRIKAIDLSSTQTDLSFKNVYEHLKYENIIMVIVIRIKHNFTVILTVSLIGAGNRLIKRKPVTFSRLLKSFNCISLYRVHIAMDSETYKYKE
jgi:hypothetical protein